MDLRCGVARSYDDDLPCGQPAAYRVVAACMHEHLTTDAVCVGCLRQLRRAGMVCVECDELPADAHVCPSAVVSVQDLTAVSVARV